MPGFVDAAVLEFVRRTAAVEDGVLRRLRERVAARGLPSITPEAGRTLEVLVRVLGARRVLEVGTCLGYSAIWMARGLGAGGRVDTIDRDAERAQEAQRWVREARLARRVHVLVGEAQALLPQLAAAAYDLVFIDADKAPMPFYLSEAIRLTRKGGVIAADNAFWRGAAFDRRDLGADAEGVRRFVSRATREPRLTATLLPLGDGLLVAHRR